MAGWNGNLPSTLEIMDVRNCLDVDSLDLGTLCTSSHINKYSRRRPGYWYVDATDKYIKFMAPRGKNYSDPRGTDPDTGLNKEYYCLHHFFGYNHSARPVGVTGGESEAWYAGDNISYLDGYRFDAGEVNWTNEDDYFNSMNNMPSYQYFCLKLEYYDKSDGTWKQGSSFTDTATKHGMLYQAPLPSNGVVSIDRLKLKTSIDPGGVINFRIIPGLMANNTSDSLQAIFPEDTIFYFKARRGTGGSVKVRIEKSYNIYTQLLNACKKEDPGITDIMPEISVDSTKVTDYRQYQQLEMSVDASAGFTSAKVYLSIAAMANNQTRYYLTTQNIKRMTGFWTVKDTNADEVQLESSASITIETKLSAAENSTGAAIYTFDLTIPSHKVGTAYTNQVQEGYNYILQLTNITNYVIIMRPA